MANWSNPLLTSTYTNFVTEVKDRDTDLALQFDGTTSTNIPTNTIRWNSSANRWQKWNGSNWAELTSLYALTGLSTTGRFGVGTSTPGTAIDVKEAAGSATTGNIRIAPITAGQARFHLFNGGATAEWIFGQKTSTDHDFKLSKLVAGSETDYLTVNTDGNVSISSGRVGIGTTSPLAPLHVASTPTGTSNLYVAPTIAGLAAIEVYNGGPTCGWRIGQRSSSDHDWSLDQMVAGVAYNKFQVTATGRVGIGTTSPSTSLEIQLAAANATSGNVYVVPPTAGQARYRLYNAGGTAEWIFGQKTGTDHDFKLSKLIAGSEVDYLAVTTAGTLQFDSGYGSNANAYGCRVWVNFDGTGTVAIRASANVSSITDNGIGQYTVNFTTAMPDANYAAVSDARDRTASRVTAYAAGSADVLTYDTGLLDSAGVSVAVFR